MGIEDYFKKNNIVPKRIEEISEEYRRIYFIYDKSRFISEFCKSNMDDFVDCVDYENSSFLFDVVAREASRYSDLFEPCCMSGLLGCYLASELEGVKYKGIDINEVAIDKAKKRAIANNLSPDIFEVKDKLEYKQKHVAVVGKYVANAYNSKRIVVDEQAIKWLSGISDNIILIGFTRPNLFENDREEFSGSFKRYGYKLDILTALRKGECRQGDFFVMKAAR